METKSHFKNAVVNFGLLFAIAGVLFMLLKSPLADPKAVSTMILGFVALFVAIAIPILATRYLKNKGSFITLGKSVKLGVLVGLLGGLLIGIYGFIYYKYINPDIVPQIVEMSNKMLEESGVLSAEQIAKQAETATGIYAPMQIVGGILSGLIYGLIGGLLGGLFFKSPRREEEY